MKKPKYYLALNAEETSLVIQSLNNLRNKLLQENKDTGFVDEMLIKVMRAPTKKI